jgi:rubrerythrin
MSTALEIVSNPSTIPSSLDRFIAHSGKIETDDLDWAEAARIGLSDDDLFTLTYFSDIESQTFRYLRTLMSMEVALQPEVSAFLTTWNYEEFFHGRALAHLLEVCGHPIAETRVADLSGLARINEWIEKIVGPIANFVFSKHFPAVYMSFGAVQEMTTLRGYESIMARTTNPILHTLCERIAKQERRHFAWYFNSAKARLENSPFAQKLTRFLLNLNWVPVGAGVKTDAEVARLFGILFPGSWGSDTCREIDQKLGTLPGLDGISLMRTYFKVV